MYRISFLGSSIKLFPQRLACRLLLCCKLTHTHMRIIIQRAPMLPALTYTHAHYHSKRALVQSL